MKKNLNQKLINLIEYYNLTNTNLIFSNFPLKRSIKNVEDNSDDTKTFKLIKKKKNIQNIKNCELKKNAKNLVFGDGNINAKIMIVGEGLSWGLLCVKDIHENPLNQLRMQLS